MGFWTFLAGGVAATKAKNMLTRPSVNFISGDFEIVSMENIGIVGTEWRIWYRKKGSSSRSSFTVKKAPEVVMLVQQNMRFSGQGNEITEGKLCQI